MLTDRMSPAVFSPLVRMGHTTAEGVERLASGLRDGILRSFHSQALAGADSMTAAPKAVSAALDVHSENAIWRGFLRNSAVRGVLRAGAHTLQGQALLRGLQWAMPARQFPELHGPGGPTRVILNSDPSQRDETNEGHILFSEIFPHRRRVHDARTVQQGLEQILGGLPNGQPLRELTFYGHGGPGEMQIGDEYLSMDHLRAAQDPRNQTPVARLLRQLRDRMDPRGTVYLRGCSCFAGAEGAAFGQALSNFLGCRVVGHTEPVGGLSRPGERSFQPQRQAGIE